MRKFCLEWQDPFDGKVRQRFFRTDKEMMRFRDRITSRQNDGLPPVRERDIIRCW